MIQKPGSEKPGFSGDLDAFIAANPQHEAKLKTQMYNKVRKCACGKPNAYTLDTCNACGKSIADTPISTTPNVFMGFVYGNGTGWEGKEKCACVMCVRASLRCRVGGGVCCCLSRVLFRSCEGWVPPHDLHPKGDTGVHSAG